MQLRPYQQAAVDATYDFLRNQSGNPIIVLPTGSGKSIILAQIVKDAVTLWNGRVLLLTHVRELIEQNADKIRKLCPEVNVGLYSAGLKKRDTAHSVICAGIQSVHERACELGAFDLILIDEAHLISARDDSMYGRFLTDMNVIHPDHRVVGLTATPFRLDSGSICGEDRMFYTVCFDVGIRVLIAQGYLSPLITKAGIAKADTNHLHVRAGEFVASEVEAVMDEDSLVEEACAEIMELTKDRKSVLVFASGVAHGQHVQRVLQDQHGVECGFVCGETGDQERHELLARFRGEQAGLFPKPPLKYLCNVNVLTTGFDAPNVDCVVLLRPTMSPGLYYQMVGRGFRLSPGKENCLVLDYGGNVLRHGPVDAIRIEEKQPAGDGLAPAKECPECRALVATAYKLCPQCGYEFPDPERTEHDASASEEGILTGQVVDRDFEVRDINYSVHTKRDAPEDAPKTFRIDYRLGLDYWVSEWVCLEHTGWARRKAESWWSERSDDPAPKTAKEAVDLANAGALAFCESLKIRSVVGEKYDKIIGYEIGPKPESGLAWSSVVDDEVPF